MYLLTHPIESIELTDNKLSTEFTDNALKIEVHDINDATLKTPTIETNEKNEAIDHADMQPNRV